MIRLIIVALVVTSFSKTMAQQPEAPKVVLFVCEHGAARSAIASAYFNQLARQRGLPYVSVFRGVQPDSVLTSGTRQGLAKDGFNTEGWAPSRVLPVDVQKSDRIVTFDCAVPLPDTKSAERWDGIPPVSRDYEKTRQQIKAKVEKLVEELAKKQ